MGNRYRGIAQLVEQWSPKPRAEGSSPSAPAKYADVAQVVAHLIGSEEVTGSIPVASFIKKVDFIRKMEDLRKRKPPEKRWFFSVWSTFGQH